MYIVYQSVVYNMTIKYFLENQVIGNFTVKERCKQKKYKKSTFICICMCGNERMIAGIDLVTKRYKSCGCLIDFNHPNYEKFFKEKFYSQTKLMENSCLIWTGVKRSGYGRINYKGKTFTCTRLVWVWEKGEIPAGFYLCHKCDNPACVNIDHLFLGTKKDNMKDCIEKGRKPGLKGEKSHRAKLNEEKVREIRNLLIQGFSIMEIAKKFNVSGSAIWCIKHNLSWNSVN